MLNPDQFKKLISRDRAMGIHASHAIVNPAKSRKTDAGFMVPYTGKRRKDGLRTS